MANDQMAGTVIPLQPRGRKVGLLAGVIVVVLLAVGIFFIATSKKPDASMIYVGSSMRQPMEQCAAAYEKKTGVKFALSFADSGEVIIKLPVERNFVTGESAGSFRQKLNSKPLRLAGDFAVRRQREAMPVGRM